MSARYLIRFDDICPTMDWKIWDGIEAVLIQHDVKPILSVIPDNQDQKFHCGESANGFWDRVRAWQGRGWTIGLHGYQHRFVTRDSGLLGLNGYSEFAGLPLEEQRVKLEKAVKIFSREGVRPDVWVAPGHSFDANTIQALVSLGIHTISDSLFLYPHRDSRGVFWIPQQLWKFRAMPFGIWTVCIHHPDELYTNLAYFRRSIQKYRHAITSLPEVVETYAQRKQNWLDAVFAGLWGFGIRARRTLLARPAQEKCLAPVRDSDSLRGRKAEPAQ
ncbi:MAG: DUF2334 domain-containing protein [Acidobacteria bacterium]|nr:DUF2334 domain-containing protein [Acidobacteriota bacterium]